MDSAANALGNEDAEGKSFLGGVTGGIAKGFSKVGHGIVDGASAVGKGVTKGYDKTTALVGGLAAGSALEEERKRLEEEAQEAKRIAEEQAAEA